MIRHRLLKAAVALSILAATAGTVQAAGIGASLLTQQHPFYIDLANAMKKAAKENNAPLEISIANQDLGKQVADIEDFIVKGVDVLIISPVDSQGVAAAIAKAGKAGVKVITVDVPAKGAAVVSHIGTDNCAGGTEAGKLMAQALGNKGKVAVIDYPTVQSVVNRVNGFKQALTAYPDMEIVAVQTGSTRTEALAAAQNMLQAHPDISGIFGFGDDAALAAAVAVKAAKLEKQVKVVGFDGMEEARRAVDANPVMAGVIRQFPEEIGKKAIETAVKVMAHEAVPAEQPVVPGVYVKKQVPSDAAD